MKKCIIHIKDEINVKLEGLDVVLRRTLEKKLKFFQPHAYHTPAYKLGRWDGCVSFCSIGGATYLNLLDRLLTDIVDDGYSIEIKDDRIPHEFVFPEITEDFHGDTVWPIGHIDAGKPVLLRDYQVVAVQEFVKNPQCLQEISTGAGKTLMTATMSKLVEPYGRSIVIVPNKDLVRQTVADYENLGLDVGVYFGDKKEIGKTHTICTWQSLNSMEKRFKEGLSELSLEEFGQGMIAVIIDECFAGDTLILTPIGQVPISEIKPGDTVINLDECNNLYKEDIVVNVHRNLTNSSTEDMLELTFDSGITINVTANHKFLTTQGWVRADQLTSDIEVIDINTYN